MKETHNGEIKTWVEWFDKRADYYKEPLMKMAYYIGGEPVPYETIYATIEDVWNKLRADKDMSIIDIAGGVGLFSKVFHSRVSRIVGTDISFNMVRDARALHPEGTFLACEAARIPFADSSFDRLLCYSAFHYFPDIGYAGRAMDEFIRVVKNKGAILIGDIPDTRISFNVPASKKKRAHYPDLLKHDLKYTEFVPDFFKDFCKERSLGCRLLSQDVKGKATASSRYDVLIEVSK